MVEPLPSVGIEFLARMKGMKSIVESAKLDQTDTELGAGAFAAFGELMNEEDRKTFLEDLRAYHEAQQAE